MADAGGGNTAVISSEDSNGLRDRIIYSQYGNSVQYAKIIKFAFKAVDTKMLIHKDRAGTYGTNNNFRIHAILITIDR